MTAMVPNSNETQIRELIEDWSQAVREKDVEKIMSYHSKEIVLFDLAPPLKYLGADSYRKGLEDWFPTFEGSIGYEFRDLETVANEDVAFVHSVNHLTGKRKNGEETDVWFRSTVGLRKIDGRWFVVHEHTSVPFYMDGSDRAAVDLKP